MRKLCLSVFLAAVSLGLILVSPGFAPFIPTEGCTPGYWKNHLSAWVEFTPSMTLGEVYGAAGFVWPAELFELYDDTLLEALEYHGGPGLLGGARIMLRQAVARLLNAAHPDVYAPDVAWAINAVLDILGRAVLNRDDILMVAGQFEYLNELGCPLNNRGARQQ
jgi:hypothetical protein